MSRRADAAFSFARHTARHARHERVLPKICYTMSSDVIRHLMPPPTSADSLPTTARPTNIHPGRKKCDRSAMHTRRKQQKICVRDDEMTRRRHHVAHGRLFQDRCSSLMPGIPCQRLPVCVQFHAKQQPEIRLACVRVQTSDFARYG